MFADRAAKSAREDPWEEREESTNPKQALDAERERERERERSNKPLGYTTRLHTGQSLFSFTPQITGRPVSATADRDRRRLIAVLIRISAELRRQRMLVFGTELDECRDKEGERERKKEKGKAKKRGGVGSAM